MDAMQIIRLCRVRSVLLLFPLLTLMPLSLKRLAVINKRKANVKSFDDDMANLTPDNSAGRIVGAKYQRRSSHPMFPARQDPALSRRCMFTVNFAKSLRFPLFKTYRCA